MFKVMNCYYYVWTTNNGVLDAKLGDTVAEGKVQNLVGCITMIEKLAPSLQNGCYLEGTLKKWALGSSASTQFGESTQNNNNNRWHNQVDVITSMDLILYTYLLWIWTVYCNYKRFWGDILKNKCILSYIKDFYFMLKCLSSSKFNKNN